MQTQNSMGTALINLFPSCPFPVMRATQEMLENQIGWRGSVMQYNSKYPHKLC